MNEQISGKIIPLTLENYQCSFYLPKDYDSSNTCYPVIYLLGESNIAPVISAISSVTPTERSVIPTEVKESVLSTTTFLLLGIETQNWESDFTPWKAEPLNKKSPAFTGGASTFLKLLATKIKPYIDNNYRTLADANNTSLIGYSLAGLTTLYALYTTHFANNFASCSGSLWYKDWISYTESQNSSQQNQLTNGRKFNGKTKTLCPTNDCMSTSNKLTNGSISKKNQLTNVSKFVSSDNTSNKQINNSSFTQQFPLTNDHSFSKEEDSYVYKNTNIPLTNEHYSSELKYSFATKSAHPMPTDRKLNIYLSLGSAEKSSRHPLMSQVETCTLKTIELLRHQFPLAKIFFEYNNGGHFTEIPTRIAKAICFLKNTVDSSCKNEAQTILHSTNGISQNIILNKNKDSL